MCCHSQAEKQGLQIRSRVPGHSVQLAQEPFDIQDTRWLAPLDDRLTPCDTGQEKTVGKCAWKGRQLYDRNGASLPIAQSAATAPCSPSRPPHSLPGTSL